MLMSERCAELAEPLAWTLLRSGPEQMRVEKLALPLTCCNTWEGCPSHCPGSTVELVKVAGIAKCELAPKSVSMGCLVLPLVSSAVAWMRDKCHLSSSPLATFCRWENWPQGHESS